MHTLLCLAVVSREFNSALGLTISQLQWIPKRSINIPLFKLACGDHRGETADGFNLETTNYNFLNLL